MEFDINYIIVVALFLGGLMGWSLFAYSLFETFCCRRKELEMIEEISNDLKKVKSDIQELNK